MGVVSRVKLLRKIWNSDFVFLNYGHFHYVIMHYGVLHYGVLHYVILHN